MEFMRVSRQGAVDERPAVVRRPQRRLVVGSSTDRAERRADVMAAHVAPIAAKLPLAEAAAGPLVPLRSTRIHRSTVAVGARGGLLDDETADRIESARGGGARIRRAVRSHLADAIGDDVCDVRLHGDRRAAELNRRLR